MMPLFGSSCRKLRPKLVCISILPLDSYSPKEGLIYFFFNIAPLAHLIGMDLLRFFI